MKWGGVETNLAKLDYAGNKLNSANTANCYIIRSTGTYQIPLVYGNAIKNGQTNVESFYTEGIATDFEDSYGVSFNASSNPYIKDHVATQGKSIASAEVLWNDGTSTITNLSVDDDFLTFDVESFSSCNALIAVKDNDGTILWSWHLWLTDTDLTPKIITNADGVDFKVMPCNLGWNGWTTNGNQTSPYYQWGRKDPLIDNENITCESISDTQEQYISHQNPKTFYYCKNSESWTTDEYNYFWDSKMNEHFVDQKVTKTIYDPCPIGWCVPQLNTFTGLSKDNTTVADNGRYCTTKEGTQDLFIPFAGYRSFGSGSVYGVGTMANCWLSATYNKGGWRLSIESSNLWCQTNEFRNVGCSVRPILTE